MLFVSQYASVSALIESYGSRRSVWFPNIFPLRMLWFQGVFTIFGGGVLVVNTLFQVVMTDVTPESQRYDTKDFDKNWL